MNNPSETRAILRSSTPPSEENKERLEAFLKQTYAREFTLEWEQDDSLTGGFVLQVGTDVYDWSTEGRLRQFREQMRKLKPARDTVIPLIREAMTNWTPEVLPEEIGHVLTVGDGIATVSGLEHAAYGEILLFAAGVKGMVQELKEGELGCILFGDDGEITEGSKVRRSGKMAGIPVGDAFLGRVVDALGAPIDGKGEIHSDDYRPIEATAPEIIDRQPVNKPMETGILAIDSMFPIGRGQRELIIGDRQTGKTAIALDTMLNQKGKNVICIYVAIGQKASSVAQVVQILERAGALDYSIVVSASASDSATLQYIAPYAGCALGEYFMEKGKDVLIVYDDLSKHAIAYRALSLLLERSPGREAYPGDVFYLHSRLLERSAHLSEEKGGGSMTALPIVETQAGDVSAYIPTNIISITDGQIFLESDLFFAGQRPAVNVGLSVSRVGGDAQTKAMKKAAGALRLDLAQYRELAVFAQFGSDLDTATRDLLAQGEKLTELLKQDQYAPMPMQEQVVLLYVMTRGLVTQVPAKEIAQFKVDFIDFVRKHYPQILLRIEQSREVDEETEHSIVNAAQEYFKR